MVVVSAPVSDRDYLLNTGEFLLDPRRLTVAPAPASFWKASTKGIVVEVWENHSISA